MRFVAADLAQVALIKVLVVLSFLSNLALLAILLFAILEHSLAAARGTLSILKRRGRMGRSADFCTTLLFQASGPENVGICF